MKDLERELKTLIITTLNLEDLTPEEIQSDAPLFVDGLGLDSIDALELGVAIKKKYNVTLQAEDSETQKHFSSIQSLADFVKQNSQVEGSL